ncbi:hypothetical protein, conserved [Eimeria necatrix]|uniref:Uncharacterized protein n=1 Tax=Eimeria necatrix TaxID=51315 RepID=U6MVY8_9EIME|nr:hypothetical protein, conserved [Eimeria necatrix]CDJ65890.1 hypothetical protein, conserved [Eimeria necatrix]
MSLFLSGFARAGAPLKAAKTLGALGASVRPFASYQGQKVTSEQLLKKNDEWLIEETNFCLGRVVETPLLKYTWDETYTEAFDE